MTLTLVLGGVRSGKSAHAERLAAVTGRPVRYIATADSADRSMADRIQTHRGRRPDGWETAEAGSALAGALAADGVSLIDGLGTWIAGALYRSGGDRDAIADEIERVIEHSRGATVIVVAEEAGQGMLPLDAVSRAWLDALGEATQQLSAAADRVDYVVAGRIVALTATGLADPTAPADLRPSLRHHGDREVTAGLRDHAVNVLAGGPPDWLSAALRRALEQDAERYPDDRPAVAALAALHGREPEEVVITNGAAEALWLLPAALTPRRAVCVHPGFTEPEAALRAHGVPVARVLRRPDDGFALNPSQLPTDAELVIVGNPASPSGTLERAGAVTALGRPGRVLVVDEAFMGMVPGEPESLAGERRPGVIVIRSLTKLLSVPGLRVGYAIAPAELADRLRAVQPPWSANALALAAIEAACAHPQELAAAARRAHDEGADLVARLAGVPGVRTWPTATNFCLIEVRDGTAVHRALRDRGFAVRHAGSFPGLGAGHLRLTARDPDGNAALVGALREAVA